jgi:hypothetical protein
MKLELWSPLINPSFRAERTATSRGSVMRYMLGKQMDLWDTRETVHLLRNDGTDLEMPSIEGTHFRRL